MIRGDRAFEDQLLHPDGSLFFYKAKMAFLIVAVHAGWLVCCCNSNKKTTAY
jgi:hypothetical protein